MNYNAQLKRAKLHVSRVLDTSERARFAYPGARTKK